MIFDVFQSLVLGLEIKISSFLKVR